MPVYTFNNFTEEKIEKGRTGYQKMTVNYSAKGEPKQKTIMSFSNPTAYNTIKGLAEGDEIEVTFVKDDKYFNWATVERVGSTPQGTVQEPKEGASKGATTPRTSVYETPEERAKKQVYIIKQSCLAQAVEFTTKAGAFTGDAGDMDAVKTLAQEFVDWVMDDGTEG